MITIQGFEADLNLSFIFKIFKCHIHNLFRFFKIVNFTNSKIFYELIRIRFTVSIYLLRSV